MLRDDFDLDKWITSAADTIDGKLGYIYELPFILTGSGALPGYQILVLKEINAKLASGRLILAQDVGGEDSTLHAYGLYLVKEATDELMALANGLVWLDAPKTDSSEEGTRDVSVHHYDDESLLAGFENTVMRGIPWQSYPGKLL